MASSARASDSSRDLASRLAASRAASARAACTCNAACATACTAACSASCGSFASCAASGESLLHATLTVRTAAFAAVPGCTGDASAAVGRSPARSAACFASSVALAAALGVERNVGVWRRALACHVGGGSVASFRLFCALAVLPPFASPHAPQPPHMHVRKKHAYGRRTLLVPFDRVPLRDHLLELTEQHALVGAELLGELREHGLALLIGRVLAGVL